MPTARFVVLATVNVVCDVVPTTCTVPLYAVVACPLIVNQLSTGGNAGVELA